MCWVQSAVPPGSPGSSQPVPPASAAQFPPLVFIPGGIFTAFWSGRGDFEESGPEIEISGQDLGFGSDVTGMLLGDMGENMSQSLENQF